MSPEEVVRKDLQDHITKGEYLQAYIRLMQILDPDLYKIAQLIDNVRKHGHGTVTVNVGKGKINSSTELLSHIIS